MAELTPIPDLSDLHRLSRQKHTHLRHLRGQPTRLADIAGAYLQGHSRLELVRRFGQRVNFVVPTCNPIPNNSLLQQLLTMLHIGYTPSQVFTMLRITPSYAERILYPDQHPLGHCQRVTASPARRWPLLEKSDG